jgi:hypothetical protein
MKQSPASAFMVRPDYFGFNSETAQSNAFQKDVLICENQHVRRDAMSEFDNFVDTLRSRVIDILVFDSPKNTQTPDAVFPNNWISMHEDGKLILYPMLTKNRRIERNPIIVDEISKKFKVTEVIDLSGEEERGRILEGTGSVVFDHVNKMAYANQSARTNRSLFYDVCGLLGYTGVFFKATDGQGMDIYHTNVLMTIGSGYAVICVEAIDKDDVAEVINSLQGSGLEVVEISYGQMNSFAGNMIELQSRNGDNCLVMSQTAFHILNKLQKERLSKYAKLVYSDISTIESVGGGSARCMIAGIHMAKK